MEIIKKFPPVYEAVCARFPEVKGFRNVIFTYGDKLYNPHGVSISPDLMIHEEVHAKQQSEMGPDPWWKKYLDDKEFRLNQELEAYRAQYKYVKEHFSRPQRRDLLKFFCETLSGPIYGHMLSKARAMELIKWNNE